MEGTVQNCVAPADGARSGLGGAEIRIATRGSVRRPGASGERGAPVRKARILWSMGGWGWWIFAGAERCGARGLAHREAGGEEKGGEGKREVFGGGGLGLLGRKEGRNRPRYATGNWNNSERIVNGQKRRYRRHRVGRKREGRGSEWVLYRFWHRF